MSEHTVLGYVIAVAVFCALALGAGTWLFKRARDRQHRDWAAIVEDDDDD